MTIRVWSFAATGSLVAAMMPGTTGAEAAFPGEDGRLAFVTARDGNYEIYSANRHGGNQQNLTKNPAADFTPAYSADGTRIAFASERDADGDAEIFVMDSDGSSPTQITHNKFFDADPAFSPDGRKLVVVRNTGSKAVDRLVIVDIATGRERVLTKGFEPMWSPSGHRIAYDRVHKSGDVEVNTIRPDGSDRHRLTHSAGFDGSPNWPPGGSRLAFTSDRTGNSDIYLMRANGAHPVRVTWSAKPDILPAWAPSGSRLSFTRALDKKFTELDIFTVRIGRPAGPHRLIRAPGEDLDADWGVAR